MNASILGKLLVLIDGSEASLAAVQFAVRLAAQVSGELHAMYVVDTATMDGLLQMRIFVAEERQEFEQDLERTGTRYLEYARTIGRKQRVEVRTHLRKGALLQVVLPAVRELNIDAIVLGGWCATMVRKDAMCEQRQLVLLEAPCPVIVVKAEPRNGCLFGTDTL